MLVGGGFFLHLTRKRKAHRRQREVEEVSNADRERLARAVARRDPEILPRLDDEGAVARLPEAAQKTARAMREQVSALQLVTASARRLILAPGPQQGLGRGEKWFFSCSDPRVSRAPQAFLKIDGGRPFLLHNRSAGNPSLVNGEPVSARPLKTGDEISLSSATRIIVKAVFADGGTWLEVVAGPDAGRGFILVSRSLALAEIKNGIFADLEKNLAGVAIIRSHERWLLALSKKAAAAEFTLRNDKLGSVVQPDPGSRLVLCPGDRLCDTAGRCFFEVSPRPCSTPAAG